MINDPTLRVSNTLMRWTYHMLLPRGKNAFFPQDLTVRENSILDYLFESSGYKHVPGQRNGTTYPDRVSYFQDVFQEVEDPISAFLPGIFFFECQLSVIGRILIAQADKGGKQNTDTTRLPNDVKPFDLPKFLYPAQCVICGTPFENLDGSNWASAKKKVKCDDSKICLNEWTELTQDFTQAFTDAGVLLSAFKSENRGPTQENFSAAKKLLQDCLPKIYKTYGYLLQLKDPSPYRTDILPEEDLKKYKYRSRYELTPHWEKHKNHPSLSELFGQDISTTDSVFWSDPIFASLAGKSIATYQNGEGMPVTIDDRTLIKDPHVLSIKQLDDILEKVQSELRRKQGKFTESMRF